MSELLTVERRDGVAVVGLNRPDQRNAINNALIAELYEYFAGLDRRVRVVVLHGHGEHFCAGLDLKELVASRRQPTNGSPDFRDDLARSRMWHRTFDLIQYGDVPVVSVLKGGVIGGGLEVASATHVRVCEPTAYFQLPEGQRGIFLGGSGSMRIPRIIGPSRVTEMMLTGRAYSVEEGMALGLGHYAVGEGAGIDKAIELATRIAGNAPSSNYAIINGIARIAEMAPGEGLFTEMMVASMARTNSNSTERIEGFFADRKARKVEGS